MGLNRDKVAQDHGYESVQFLRQTITYAKETVQDFSKKLPANAIIVGGGVHIKTAFNGAVSNVLDVGFRDGSSADDPNALATLLPLGAIGYIALDELAAVTNIRQTKDAIPTSTYTAGTPGTATVGEADIVIMYVV